jgi:hypothetical protein
VVFVVEKIREVAIDGIDILMSWTSTVVHDDASFEPSSVQARGN